MAKPAVTDFDVRKGQVLYLLGIGPELAVFAFIIEWLSDRLHRFTFGFPADIDLYLLVTLVGLFFTVFFNLVEALARVLPGQKRHDVGTVLYFVVFWAGFFLIGFSGFCRHWYLAFGGYRATTIDYWQWLRFGLSWVLETFTFNLSQIYGWTITNIQATTFLTRLWLVVFNVALEAMVVGGVVRMARLGLHARR
jgi:hypothetical protein